jgi:hypothetical protein
VLFLGCSSDKASESNLTLDDFIKAYTEQGIEVNKEKKPVFSLIKASDGVIFYVDNKKAAIYEYPSEKDMNEVIKDQKLMEQWTKKGKFILESKSEKAINIFNQVK